jgi:nucleotide-binding universal stress UspA family protein
MFKAILNANDGSGPGFKALEPALDLASEGGADLLVIGATAHSALYERMLGSRADRVVQLAPCPVLVVK